VDLPFAMIGHVYIGISGWNYVSWKDGFYAGIPRKDWLRFAASQFTAIEVNATFYRLQEQTTFKRWRDETPKEFRFVIKGHRYLTHNKKLIDPATSILLERERAKGLGDKLAVVVWQLPQRFQKNLERLAGFAKALQRWPEARHAVEFRHPSWFDDEVAECLQAHRIANCLSDAADWPLWDAVTTDFVYVRLHGHARTYASGYSKARLESWADKIRRWRRKGYDVHVYFDNDAEGHAPFDALRLMKLVERK